MDQKCRNCQWLLVKNITPSGKRGSGICRAPGYCGWARGPHIVYFSDSCKRSYTPRVSPLEIGRGGKKPDDTL